MSGRGETEEARKKNYTLKRQWLAIEGKEIYTCKEVLKAIDRIAKTVTFTSRRIQIMFVSKPFFSVELSIIFVSK